MNFYKRYPGDYMGKTAHLSLIEHGAYNVLLDHCYSNELPLPADHDSCYRIARAFSKDERAAVDSVLRQFFKATDDGYVQNRVQKEFKKAGELADRNKANGLKGGRPKQTDEEPKNNPVGLQDETETKGIPDTRYQIPDDQTTKDQKPDDQIPGKNGNAPPAAPSRFAEFWALYPVHRDKQKALDLWKRRKLDDMADTILDDIRNRQKRDAQWKQGYIPHPTTYLRNSRWEDEFTSPKKRDGYDEFLEDPAHGAI